MTEPSGWSFETRQIHAGAAPDPTWLGRTLLGTTDNDYEGDLERVRPASDDNEGNAPWGNSRRQASPPSCLMPWVAVGSSMR